METKRPDNRLSDIEYEITKEIDGLKIDGMSLAGGFFNRDRDALLGRVLRELDKNISNISISKAVPPYCVRLNVPRDYEYFSGDTLLEAGLKALKYYLEKKERG